MITLGMSSVSVTLPNINLPDGAVTREKALGNYAYQEILNVQLFRFTASGSVDVFAAAFAIDGSGEQLSFTNFTKGFEGASLKIMADALFHPNTHIWDVNGDYGMVVLTLQYDPSQVSSSEAKLDSIRIANLYSQIFKVSFLTDISSVGYSPSTLYYYYSPVPIPKNGSHYQSWSRRTINETLGALPSNGFASILNYQYLQNLDNSENSLPVFFTYIMNSSGYLYPEYYFGKILGNYSDGQHSLNILRGLNVSALQSERGAVNITCNPAQRSYYGYLSSINTGYYFKGVDSNLNNTYASSNFTEQNSGDGFFVLLNADAPITTLTLLFNTISHPSILDIFEANKVLFLGLEILIPITAIVIAMAKRKMKRASPPPQQSAG